MKNINNIIGNKIHFFPSNLEYEHIGSELHTALDIVGKSGKLILGPKVNEFETKLKEFIKMQYSVSCASGTDAITLALKSLNLKNDSEVLVPANAYPTIFGVALSGVKPRLIDVEKNTGHINPDLIVKNITKNTRAVIVVHLYGMSADILKIKRICKEKNLYLIEDCAQSFGGRYEEKMLGSFGDLSIFSFYPTKNLGAYGDGGAILTNRKDFFDKLLMIRMYGEKNRYDSQLAGQNSRLDEIQAAFLLVKMKYIEEWIKKRKFLANIYNKELNSISEISLMPLDKKRDHVYHLYTIRLKDRDKLKIWLEEANIETGIHYPKPIHYTKTFSKLGLKKEYPMAEKWSSEVLSLPIHPYLKEEEVYYVCKKIKEYFT